jgi:probable rRNA maturation factor
MIERPSVGGKRRIGGDGEPDVFVTDEQTDVTIDVMRWRDLALGVLAAEGVRGDVEMALLFVDEPAITGLNAEFMEERGSTDVLSFPIDGDIVAMPADEPHRRGPTRPEIDLGDLPLLLGDVVICPAVAARNAPTHAGTLDDELALLVVHGILHLLGHDHAEPDERAAMQAAERGHLETLHWHGPAPTGFRLEHLDDSAAEAD